MIARVLKEWMPRSLFGRSALIVMVPVAAILVASMKFHCLDHPLDLQYKGPNRIPCEAQFNRGDEMGYFQQGSTIIVFAPNGFQICAGIETGQTIRMGKPLLSLPVADTK